MARMPTSQKMRGMASATAAHPTIERSFYSMSATNLRTFVAPEPERGHAAAKERAVEPTCTCGTSVAKVGRNLQRTAVPPQTNSTFITKYERPQDVGRRKTSTRNKTSAPAHGASQLSALFLDKRRTKKSHPSAPSDCLEP